MPIVVRPHPNKESDYQYEHVSGQCRFKAAADLDMKTIPTVIINLDDDAAIQRSWGENEARGDMIVSDKAHWVEKIFKKFNGDDFTREEALEKAAKFLSVKKETAMGYYTLVMLPDDLKEMVDGGILNQGDAKTIVKKTYQGRDPEASQEEQKDMQRMRERVKWLIGLERAQRKAGIKAIENCGHDTSIDTLQQHVDKAMGENNRTITYAIPKENYERFIDWGKNNIGSDDPSTIIGGMVAQTLK